MLRVTTQVNAADYFEQRDQALRAHATQIDPAGTFFGTPVEVQQKNVAHGRIRTGQNPGENHLPRDRFTRWAGMMGFC